MLQSTAPANVASDPIISSRSANWWLRLTSHGWDRQAKNLEERELTRRSQLASWVLAGLLIVDAILLPIGFSDPGTLAAVLIAGACAIGIAYMNRRGLVTLAGVLSCYPDLWGYSRLGLKRVWRLVHRHTARL